MVGVKLHLCDEKHESNCPTYSSILQPPVISLTVLLGQKEVTQKQTIFHVKLAKIPFIFGHIVCTGFYMYWLTKLRKSSSRCFYVVALYTVV